MRRREFLPWFIIPSLVAGVAFAVLPRSTAAAGSSNPLQYSERTSQDFHNKIAAKVSVTVPYDAATVGTVDGTTRLTFQMGRFWWSDTLDRSNWQEGKTSAKWTPDGPPHYQDFYDDGQGLIVRASWKGGALRVKVQVKRATQYPAEDGMMSQTLVWGSADDQVRRSFNAELSWGGQEFHFDGSAHGTVSFKPMHCGPEDPFCELPTGDDRRNKTVLSGTAVLVLDAEDHDQPLVNCSPGGGVIQDATGGVTVFISGEDASTITAVSYSLDGGDPVPVQFADHLYHVDYTPNGKYGFPGYEGRWLHMIEGASSLYGGVRLFVPLPEGSHTLQCIVTDEFGNTSDGPSNTSLFDYKIGPPQ